ncbi:SLC17A5 [Mytilus coruscus]|uniref:SLC17A5 n=1 Tax=Mytilus coruscus TaxID=42192 RepID=A0A6J8CFL5_MYTCO|nr:SLC17A5 [Mytilus coruscus]
MLTYIPTFTGTGSFLVEAGFVSCEKKYLAVMFLCLALTMTGFTTVGFPVNHIDVAPKYSGILLGISNTVGTIPGMVDPLVAGALTPNVSTTCHILYGVVLVVKWVFLTNFKLPIITLIHDTQEEWRNVFYIYAAFYVIGIIVFGGFARGEVQSWAKDKDTENNRLDM